MKTCNLFLIILLAVISASCSDEVKVVGAVDEAAPIYPDYQGVTIPANIAPLNFNVVAEGKFAAVFSYGDSEFTLKAKDGLVDIPAKRWCQMLEASLDDSITVTVCRKDAGGWVAYKPFALHVSADSIDNTLVYRLIPPLYGTWRYIGIYQRDLESYEQKPIYENTAYHGNCVNCHSFCARNPEKMSIHLRGPGGGTYLTDGVDKYNLNTKTDSTIANFTYPYWHPDGRYVAYSVNDIFQVFHSTDPNRTEVIDDKSDVVVYDIARRTVMSSPLIKDPARLETFPAFSADGKILYFCSAVKPDTLPDKYRDVHYSLCSIAFDADSGTFGEVVDTIYTAGVDNARSISQPRPSPDGRWLVATNTEYGNFPIWHKDADLWLYDINAGNWRPLQRANSADVDSYHSWSSNSRWLVFSSRRDDGLYTRPYIVHISADGYDDKPFMLPQRNPRKHYTDQENSYNIPELVSAPVPVTTRDMVDWICQPQQGVRYE